MIFTALLTSQANGEDMPINLNNVAVKNNINIKYISVRETELSEEDLKNMRYESIKNIVAAEDDSYILVYGKEANNSPNTGDSESIIPFLLGARSLLILFKVSKYKRKLLMGVFLIGATGILSTQVFAEENLLKGNVLLDVQNQVIQSGDSLVEPKIEGYKYIGYINDEDITKESILYDIIRNLEKPKLEDGTNPSGDVNTDIDGAENPAEPSQPGNTETPGTGGTENPTNPNEPENNGNTETPGIGGTENPAEPKEPVDTNALEELIEESKELKNTYKFYNEESIEDANQFIEAIRKAEETLSKEQLTKDDVDSAINELNTAKEKIDGAATETESLKRIVIESEADKLTPLYENENDNKKSQLLIELC